MIIAIRPSTGAGKRTHTARGEPLGSAQYMVSVKTGGEPALGLFLFFIINRVYRRFHRRRLLGRRRVPDPLLYLRGHPVCRVVYVD